MILPKRIHLPFVKPIKVKEVPATDPLIAGCDGLWDDEERTIYIRQGLKAERARKILYHELLHCVHDVAYQLEWDD